MIPKYYLIPIGFPNSEEQLLARLPSSSLLNENLLRMSPIVRCRFSQLKRRAVQFDP